MDLAVFYEVIVPLLEVQNTTMIMISTPGNSGNFFSQLFLLKDPQTRMPLFLIVDCELVCDRCKTKRRPTDCVHMLAQVPPWKESGGVSSARQILKDHQAIMQRELFGSVADDSRVLIDRRTLEMFKAREPWRPRSDEQAMFPWCMVTLDPNSSGKIGSSETALAAMVFRNGQYYIVGLDSHACASAVEVQMFVESFLKRLWTMPELHGTRFIFCAERNMAHESGFIAGFVLQRFPSSVAIAQHANNDYGWYTDHAQKILYAQTLVMRLREQAVSFTYNARCGLPAFLNVADPDERWTEIKEKLFEQLARYRIVQSHVHNALSIAKTTVSGKVDSDGRTNGTFHDDLVFAVSMGLWLTKQFVHGDLPNMPPDVMPNSRIMAQSRLVHEINDQRKRKRGSPEYI